VGAQGRPVQRVLRGDEVSEVFPLLNDTIHVLLDESVSAPLCIHQVFFEFFCARE
jgi:hypothetical protein